MNDATKTMTNDIRSTGIRLAELLNELENDYGKESIEHLVLVRGEHGAGKIKIVQFSIRIQ